MDQSGFTAEATIQSLLKRYGLGRVLQERQMLACERRNSEDNHMGTWGPGPFDTDAATDWYLALIETSALSQIEEVLDPDIIEDKLFGFPDMDLIEPASEVVLGLLAPDVFEKRSKAAPTHIDPLVDGLGVFRDLKNRSPVTFSIPSELVDWVKQYRHLDAKPLLVPANTLLTHVKACGEPFYDGFLLNEGMKEAWLSYIDNLQGRLGKAIQT